jgi:hypothetical protein
MDLKGSGADRLLVLQSTLEIETLTGAYREDVAEAVAVGREATDQGLGIANWGPTQAPHTVKLADPREAVAVLDTFNARTKRAAGEIPGITSVPPFENRLVAKRYTLGRHAVNMARQLEEMICQLDEAEQNAEVTKERRKEIDDLEKALEATRSSINDDPR